MFSTASGVRSAIIDRVDQTLPLHRHIATLRPVLIRPISGQSQWRGRGAWLAALAQTSAADGRNSLAQQTTHHPRTTTLARPPTGPKRHGGGKRLPLP